MIIISIQGCQVDGGGVQVRIDSPKPRQVQLEILAPRPASGVRRDGTVLDEKADPGDFAAANSAWRHDNSANGFLEIKFPHGGGSTTVTFSDAIDFEQSSFEAEGLL